MSTPEDRPRIARDFVWRQSTIADYLRCPRRVLLEHVQGMREDHRLTGYASIVGTALHEVAALALTHAQGGDELPADEAEACVDQAFGEALERAMEEGATTDEETVVPALERAQALAVHVAGLSADPRVRAIDWQGIEEEFSFELEDGRAFSGTIDAWGVARQRVELAPGVIVERGQHVVVDWKSGEAPVDYPSRDLSVQLAVYAGSVVDDVRDVVPAYGLLRDLAPPLRPKAEDGGGIPAVIRELNPCWLELAGVSEAEAASSKKRPKDPTTGEPVVKWLERPNPAHAEATSRPRGQVFYPARIDWQVVSQTVADVIDAARAGLFPAAGAVTGECRRCPLRTRCAHQGEDEVRT